MCLHVDIRARCFPQTFSILELIDLPGFLAVTPGEAPPLTSQSMLGLHMVSPDFCVVVRDQIQVLILM